MSALTDTLIDGLNKLLKSGNQIPASDLRAFESLMVGAIGTLEARARGNTIICTSGKPDDALGMQGDLGVNKDNGDVYNYDAGTFTFLFNILPGKVVAGDFDPYDVPVTLRDWVADPARVWFGPAGGNNIYLRDTLPAPLGAIAGMDWDDPDATVRYVVKPVAFADVTIVTVQRTALIAP